MNRSHVISLLFHVLGWTATAALVGCGSLASTPAPTSQPQPPSAASPVINPTQPLPTTALPFIHYSPSNESKIHLEFDYPGSWTFSEDIQDANFMVVGLGDPRFRALPTSPDSHPTPNDFGSIIIWITPGQPGQTPDTELQALKQNYSNDFRYILSNDYKIMIDGYDASVLEYKVEPAQDDYPSVMFNRRIFLLVKEQMYEILFALAEKDRGGEFEQGYEYFFKSIKVVP